MQRLLMVAAVAVVFAPRMASAQCTPATCNQNSIETTCLTEIFSCVREGGVEGCGEWVEPTFSSPALPIEPMCPIVCEEVDYSVAPSGTACASDNLACTTDECNGTGTCTHVPIAGIECSGTCVTSGCCANPNSCPGGAVCPANGGACMCPSGEKSCNGGCIPNADCCVNSDCPSDPANNRVGVCGAGGCAYACATNYKACGATCIPSTQCCSAADCTSPPNGCYKTPGTCTSGVCAYVFNDGASCNADNNACTPNDTCMNGGCVADTAHQVTCVQRACYTAPACNPTTGNCADTMLANGAACGGDGCLPPGTCTTGACSTASQAVDCSALTTDCAVGVCDPNKAGTGTQKCATNDVTNGIVCSESDLCEQNPLCSGGTCTGTPKACPAPGPCTLSACTPSTGDCANSMAAAGTNCVTGDACSQNATCDGNGNCNGDPVPDGTPCSRTDCATASSACVSGACTCLARPGDPVVTTSDMGTTSTGKSGKHGCSAAPGSPGEKDAQGVLTLLGLCLLFVARRARSARAR